MTDNVSYYGSFAKRGNLFAVNTGAKTKPQHSLSIRGFCFSTRPIAGKKTVFSSPLTIMASLNPVKPSDGLSICLEVVEDSLPSGLLLLHRVKLFGIKCCCHFCCLPQLLECRCALSSISHGIGYSLLIDHLIVNSFEIKSNATIPGFHAGAILPVFSQVVHGLR